MFKLFLILQNTMYPKKYKRLKNVEKTRQEFSSPFQTLAYCEKQTPSEILFLYVSNAYFKMLASNSKHAATSILLLMVLYFIS